MCGCVSVSVCVVSVTSVSEFLLVVADEHVDGDPALLHLRSEVRFVLESEHQHPHTPPVGSADQSRALMEHFPLHVVHQSSISLKERHHTTPHHH